LRPFWSVDCPHLVMNDLASGGEPPERLRDRADLVVGPENAIEPDDVAYDDRGDCSGTRLDRGVVLRRRSK